MTTEQHVIRSSCGEYTRDVWLLHGPEDRLHRLSIFLDAEYYLRDMNCVPIIRDLVEREAIPPISCLFVSHLNGSARHQDLTCNAGYSRFIAEDAVRWANDKCDNLKSGGNLICGVVYTTLQSTNARFWLSVGDEETATNVSHPATGLFQEVSQIDGVERAARALESLGATVRFNLFSGGHSFAPWREELAPALRWLLRKATTQPTL